jgi:conjugative transposon TraM protein
MPSAQIKEELGGKYENMLKSYGKIEDYSAVENIEVGEESDNKEAYDSRYTDEDLAALDAEAAKRMAELEQEGVEGKLRQSQRRGETMMTDSLGEPLSEEERLARSKQRQDQALEELNKALAQARLAGQKGVEGATDAAKKVTSRDTLDTSRNLQGKVEINERLVSQPSENEAAASVVKKIRTNSDYFNTLAENESEPHLIKAIIDEDIKCVEGSRVRLRILDDIEINEVTLTKGSYLYAEMSGFGSQRVKGNVSSILVHDELIKVGLTIYDTDGLEGLYVPKSSFRETTNDIASSAMSGSMSVNNGNANNTFSQWGIQAVNNAYQRTANALSKNIRKNKAKLKYGTFVYLVNSKEKKK